MSSTTKNVCHSLSLLTLLIATGSATNAVASPLRSGLNAGSAPALDALTDVLSASDDSTMVEFAARHDDDDTLIEHHHIGLKANSLEVVASKFVV